MGGDRLRSTAFFVQYLVLLVTGLVWVQFEVVRRDRVGDNLGLFYLLLGVALCYLGLRAYLVLARRVSGTWGRLWLSVDLVLITCAVHLTGGIKSEVALVYFWPIATSSIPRRPRRTLVVGLFTGVLYTAATWPADPTQEYLITLGVRLLILVLVTLLAFCYALTETARVEELARLREKLALSDYRTRLSQEMHDGIQHYLADIAVRLEVARKLMAEDPKQAASIAVDQRFAVRQAADELRYLVRLLRSPAVEREGFLDALRHHLSLFAQRSAIAAPLEIEGCPTALAPEVAHAAFRITQEALTNIEKHARARQAKVTLRFGAGVVECTVADDGVGFDASAAAERPHIEGGLGLSSMKERAESVGGSVEIDSVPGRGTKMTLTVPTGEERITPAEDLGDGEDQAADCGG